MCFIIEESNSKERIAEENIECFKVLLPTNFGGTISAFRGHPYHINKFLFPCRKKVSELIVEREMFSGIINEGLHSYSSLQAAQERYSKPYNIFVAYIPKGAKYYYNSFDEEYVSTELVVTTKRIKE